MLKGSKFLCRDSYLIEVIADRLFFELFKTCTLAILDNLLYIYSTAKSRLFILFLLWMCVCSFLLPAYEGSRISYAGLELPCIILKCILPRKMSDAAHHIFVMILAPARIEQRLSRASSRQGGGRLVFEIG